MWDILPSSTKIIWVPLLLKIFGSKKYLLSAVAGCLPPTTWPHWLLPAYQPQQTAVMTASDVTAQPASLCLPQLIMQTIPAIRLTMFNIQYNMIYCTYNVGCRIYCSEVRSETTEENRISNKVTFFHLILLYLKWEGRSELVGQIFSSEPGRAGEEGGGRSSIVGHDVLPCTALYCTLHCTWCIELTGTSLILTATTVLGRRQLEYYYWISDIIHWYQQLNIVQGYSHFLSHTSSIIILILHDCVVSRHEYNHQYRIIIIGIRNTT